MLDLKTGIFPTKNGARAIHKLRVVGKEMTCKIKIT